MNQYGKMLNVEIYFRRVDGKKKRKLGNILYIGNRMACKANV